MDLRHFGRVAGYATFCTSERHAYYGALPGHPGGESCHLAKGDVRSVADATLPWSPASIVDHTIAGVDLERAVVQLNWDGEDQLTGRGFEVSDDARLKLQVSTASSKRLSMERKGPASMVLWSVASESMSVRV